MSVFVIMAFFYSASVLRFGSWVSSRGNDITYAQIAESKHLKMVSECPEDPKMASKIITLYQKQGKLAPPLVYVGHNLQQVTSKEEAIRRFSLEPLYSPNIFIEEEQSNA